MGRTPSTDELVPELTFDEIDRAFDNNEFCFYLQPKCNAATGAIVGAEALVRWNHPKYGVVSPGRFVPMLEQAGQISRLDVFVWRSVVRMLARWEREGRNLVPISVNVSMVDIDQMDVADTLTGLLNEYDVDARLLQAEITESAVARNLSKVESTIRKLHADNIAVLMDDFGSAYSSLNMLKDINVDVIKLDMKFIDLDEDNASKGLKIVESVVNMARKLRLLVIAEGAQTKQQVDQLLCPWDAGTSKGITSTNRFRWDGWRSCWPNVPTTGISGICQTISCMAAMCPSTAVPCLRRPRSPPAPSRFWPMAWRNSPD